MAVRHARVSNWLVLFTNPELEICERHFDNAVAAMDDSAIAGMLSVIDHDGFPRLTLRQYHRISEAVMPHRYPVAVITAHRTTRAVLRSFGWRGASMRDFPSERFHEALEWLKIPPEDHERIHVCITELRIKLELGED